MLDLPSAHDVPILAWGRMLKLSRDQSYCQRQLSDHLCRRMLLLESRKHADTDVRRCGITTLPTLSRIDFPDRSSIHVADKHAFEPPYATSSHF
jgi:hypothetical protein